KLKKQGRVISPVVIQGRKIAKSFWGKAWCDNLERYSDYANRLPRGRTYVNNGSVIDLQLTRGKVEALVSGSEIYKIKIDIAVAASARWKAICADCAGSVGSIVELLQGKLSTHVMERVCRPADGLFPTPKEIKLSCSCPDGAYMCKHVAATLYGVGARLDHDPDLLFTLRGVERSELVSTGADLSITQAAAGSERVLAGDDVAALFGLALETAPPEKKTPPVKKATATKKTPAAKKATVAKKMPVAKKVTAAKKAPHTPAKSVRTPKAASKTGRTSTREGLGGRK
ncbi:MAG: SWIM zinc finger family protein, partial [Rhodanobacter sp.]|nr:SWIM zinc finger family protein [Rhodanobacter sp.]